MESFFLSDNGLSPGSGGMLWAPTEDTIWSIDLSQNLFGFGSAASLTPYGLTYTRAASPLAAQWGTGNVFDLSFFAGSADVHISTRFNDSYRAGLALGEARTNLVLQWRNFGHAAWTKFGTPTLTAGQSDPFGGSGATRVQAPSGIHGLSETASGSETEVVISQFLKGAAPNFNLYRVVGGVITGTTAASVGAWSRISLAVTGAASATAAEPVDGRDWSAGGGLAAGARDATIDVVQREAGRFPSDPIPTTGTAATRAATFLNLTSAKVSEGLIAGRLQLELNLRAQGSLAEIGGSPHLLWADANNRMTINAATGVISLVIGGVTNTTSALAIARYDEINLFVCFGGGVATTFVYRINGGVWQTLVVAGAALGNITPANMYLLSQSTAGAHFSAWLYKVAAYKPNRRPLWTV